MSATVLLNLINKLGEKIRCETLSRILSFPPNEFNEFNSTYSSTNASFYVSYNTKFAFNL